MITQTQLLQLFDYDELSGKFIRKIKIQGGGNVGTEAGTLTTNGYIGICVDGKIYYAHRLVWLYVYGIFPKQCIDHINGQRADNRLCNLRAVTNAQNSINLQHATKNSTTGFLGVSKVRDKFRARIHCDGAYKHLGYFLTPEQAHEAYINARMALHNI